MQKSKTLFIPALTYLSNKLFIPILPHLKEMEAVYLDCDYALNKEYSKNYAEELKLIRQTFDNTEIIITNDKYNLSADQGIFNSTRYYLKKRDYNKKTIRSIKNINPNLIVLTSDQTDTFKLVTNYFNHIPILILQQGSLANAENLPPSFKKQLRHYLFKMLFRYPTLANSKSIAAGNLHYAYWSKFWNAPTEHSINLYFTGNGALDTDILKGNTKLEQAFTSKEELNLLYTTQPISSIHGSKISESVHQMVLDYVIQNPEINLKVKVHPRENEDFYKKYFNNKSIANIEVTKEAPLVSLIEESDIMLTAWSMTSYQSVALGVPVISLNPDNLFDYSKRFPGQCIPQVSNLLKLQNAIKFITSREGYAHFITERKSLLKIINTSDDGQSSMRIANLIMSIAQGTV